MIVLSAGHYPQDKGAVFESRNEHDEALKWLEHIVLTLRKTHDVMVVPTGPLPAKVTWINALHHELKVSIAVELHFNSDPLRRGIGCETLYCPGSVKGRAAASILQDGLATVFPPNRGIKEGWYRQDRPGHVDYANDIDGDEKVDYFLKATNMTALIVEPLFMHQTRELDAHWGLGCDAIVASLKTIAS